jgi:hypothetical protein
MARRLRTWNKTVFGHRDKKLFVIQQDIKALEGLGEQRGLTESEKQ